MKFTVVIVLFAFTISSILGFWIPIYGQVKNQRKLTLAVLPFSNAGVREYEAISLSNRLHSELIKTRRFRVVENEKVNDILKEMGFQQIGACTSEECVVQVGNMLGARLMVTGSVGKVGRTYTVDVRIIDVQTRGVLMAKTGNTRGKIDELLVLMSQIARIFANPGSEPPVVQEKEGKKWWWLVGSTILIGGGITAWLLTEKVQKGETVQVIGTPPDPPKIP